MKLRIILILIIMSSVAHSEDNFGIVIHGGAGVMSGLSEESQKQIHKKIKETVSEAYSILENGGSSLDAVELAVSILEDSPLFNAGRGSVYNSDEIQDLTIRILNIVGSEFYREEKQSFVGEYIKQISLDNYGKGIYFLEIETKTGTANKKLILQ